MTKPIILVKICYKLLYVIQGVENSFGKGLMQLISEFLAHMPVNNVASDWPCTFLHPRCFCLAFELPNQIFYIQNNNDCSIRVYR